MSVFPSTWETVDLGHAGRWYSGGTPNTRNPEYWSGTIPWISSSSLTNFRLWNSDRRVTDAGSRNGTRMVEPGTILMVVRGMSLKSEFRVGMAMRPMAFGQDCKALVARGDIHPEFLGYAIRAQTPRILGLVDEAGHGTGRLNTDQLLAVEIGVPPSAEQRAIAEVLGALDDKIAANTQLMNKADEFIDYSFRSALQSSQTVIKPLLDVFHFEFGEAFKGENFVEPGTGRPLIRIRDLKTFSSQVWTTETRPKEILVDAGDVVVGMDAEFRAVAWQGEPGLLNQRVCRVTSSTAGRVFVREALKKPLATIENYKTGTTVIHLNKKDLESTSVEIPEVQAIRTFEESTERLYQLRIGLAGENRTLAATRDALLPQLISGKLRVKDAERTVGDVL